MQGRARPDPAPCLAHRELGGGDPILPHRFGQCAGDGAMGRGAQADRDIAGIAVAARDVSQAIGRISQPMQQHHRAARRPIRRQHIGAIPVLRKAAGVDRAAREVAVIRALLLRRELFGDRLARGVENLRLGGEITRPIELADSLGMQVGGDECMPGL